MINHVIVPLDGSDTSEAALPHAIRLARTLGTPIMLVHVIDTSRIYDTHAIALLPDRFEMERYLGDIAVREGIEAIVEIEVRYGTPAYKLLQLAEVYPLGVFVMSTHGRGGLSRIVMGSVADQIVRNGTTPVMVIRADSAQQPRDHYANLLVTLDGSDLASSALPPAIDLARRSGATLHLLRVVEPLNIAPESEYSPDATWLAPDEADQVTTDRESSARDELDRLAASVRDRGLNVRTLVRAGQPTAEILRETLASEADVILMASHGRGGLRRLRMGSVTTSVIQRATVPLLVVPAGTTARIQAPEHRRALATATG
jgi:nucleotide-binding universal stress UspA family protein